MLNLIGKGTAHTCDEHDATRLSPGRYAGCHWPVDCPSCWRPQARGAVDPQDNDKSVIMIFNLGAPSQLDLFDMKPEAPAEIRGPFKPIATSAPGVEISEILPLHAKLADKFSLVRSCYHTAAAVHDTGHQMMQIRPAV